MRKHIVAVTRSWIGTPYHHQASVKSVGCDCLGLVRGVFEEVYGPVTEAVPAYTRDWAEARGEEMLIAAAERHLRRKSLREDLRPGDVLVFRLNVQSVAKHVGILSQAGKMIHAQEKVGCVEVAVGRWWRRRVAASFEFPGA